MPKIQNKICSCESGTERIEEIKNNISSCCPKKYCKADVYEMWNDTFDQCEN